MSNITDTGYRVIAHDRRGHGRSTQTAHGHDMDTYAQDAAAVVDALNLTDELTSPRTHGTSVSLESFCEQFHHCEPMVFGLPKRISANGVAVFVRAQSR
jgi:alpha-beta hydrolase superfamily lysophospholipase